MRCGQLRGGLDAIKPRFQNMLTESLRAYKTMKPLRLGRFRISFVSLIGLISLPELIALPELIELIEEGGVD
jgi:hypothetical protein